MASGRAFDSRVAVVVLDGWGISPRKEWDICEETWKRLPEAFASRGRSLNQDEDVVCAAVAPLSHGVSVVLAERSGKPWNEVFSLVRQTRCRWINAVGAEAFENTLGDLCRQVADQHRFIPWSVPLPRLFALRQDVPTFITRTAGVYTGQELSLIHI